MKKSKILVVLTGGTIGSRVSGTTIDISDNSQYCLIEEYKKLNEPIMEQVELETVEPYTILSENTTLNVWTQLCAYLATIDYSQYQGIIITHGTDTYSYTAAMLGTLYDSVMPLPMVLVASNYAIGEPMSNGLSNFKNAVSFINQSWCHDKHPAKCIDMMYAGVYCIYEDRFGVSNVYRAVEITESDTCIDQFGVYGGEVYGIMEKGRFVKNQNHVNHCEPIVTVNQKDVVFMNEVIMLKTYPGLNYNYISLENLMQNHSSDKKNAKKQAPQNAGEAGNTGEAGTLGKPAAVLHTLYHSATACVSEENESIVHFMERCSKAGIPSYLCGFKKGAKAAYASTRIFEKNNITKLYDLSPEAAYANVLLLMNKK